MHATSGGLGISGGAVADVYESTVRPGRNATAAEVQRPDPTPNFDRRTAIRHNTIRGIHSDDYCRDHRPHRCTS